MNALDYINIFYLMMSGLGFFFLGVGAVWFVSVYKEKNEE